MLLDDLISARRSSEASGQYEFHYTLEESIEMWHEKIGMKIDPEEMALEAHKALLAARGIEWDDTDVSQIEELAAKMEESIPGEFMGGPRRGL